MRSMAQFCIKDLHDATPSETPPADPITGQLWIDISVSPPVTKVWNGTEWEQQNGISKILAAVDAIRVKNDELRDALMELGLYSGTENESIQAVNERVDGLEAAVASLEEDIEAVSSDVSALTAESKNAFHPGMNVIPNSAFLNGTEGWTVSGTVHTERTTDTIAGTASGTCLVIGDGSGVSTTVTGLLADTPYVFSFRAQKPSMDGTGYANLTVSGNTVLVEELLKQRDWYTVSYIVDSIPDGVITVSVETAHAVISVADFVLSVGTKPRGWAPKPGEHYGAGIKADGSGLSLDDGDGRETKVKHNEVSVVKDGETVFAVSDTGISAKNAEVGNDLTAGKILIRPCDTASAGADIYLLT